MRTPEVQMLAVMLERHDEAVPATSLVLADNIYSTMRVYEMGGHAVSLDELIMRHKRQYPWLFNNWSETP